MRAGILFPLIALSLILVCGRVQSALETTVPISAELGTSIAADLFPVTIKLTRANVYLTEPVMLFLDNGRIGMQLRFQAYDHRPAEGIAISEMGRARISGTLGYDADRQQVLLHDPRIDALEFEQKNDVTQRLLTEMNTAWSTQITDPIRAELPPHPYLLPFRKNIRTVTYDGKFVLLAIAYD